MWEKDALVSVSDNQGRKLSFKYNPITKKVAEIFGPNGLSAKYAVKGEDLTEVIDAKAKNINSPMTMFII